MPAGRDNRISHATLSNLLLTLLLISVTVAPYSGAPPLKPKLVLAIVIDQFRYDYLLRFRADYIRASRACWITARCSPTPIICTRPL